MRAGKCRVAAILLMLATAAVILSHGKCRSEQTRAEQKYLLISSDLHRRMLIT